MIRIRKAKTGFEIEPLKAPLGFKGGCLTGLWQAAVSLEGESGMIGTGLGVQSVLWSDPSVFSGFDEKTGNEIMFSITRHAAKLAEGMAFDTPADLLDALLPAAYEYGKERSGRPDLRLTFALNALVAVDNAAWMLYCGEKGIRSFDGMIPRSAGAALSSRHAALANIPLISYGIPGNEIEKLLDGGCCLLKIKIGSDPEKDGDSRKMLEWDKKRLSLIHGMARDRATPHTRDGRVSYYLDANGRYGGRDTLMRFLDHADRIGALGRILLLEEPFPEECGEDVSDLPVRIAADESAHSDADAPALIGRGYGAIALKPAAKTLSMSFRILKAAHERNVPCFCADLTVNPVLVDWNKNVAARLAPLPGMRAGVLESNGPQNYAGWERMRTYHPCGGAGWAEAAGGIYGLDGGFYESSGGIFGPLPHYEALLRG